MTSCIVRSYAKAINIAVLWYHMYIINLYTKIRMAKISKNNVGHRCANFWKTPLIKARIITLR